MLRFVTAGESDYYPTMKMNVDNIRKFHPEAEIHIGDIGLTDKQKEQLGGTVWDLTGADTERQKMGCKVVLMNLIPLPAVFIDGDAVLVRPFDLEPEGDMIVTVRNSHYGRINSGVFVASSEKMMKRWLDQTLHNMEYTNDRLAEQNALNEIAGEFDCKEVSCDQYNYPKVEKGIPDDVRVVHLKSGRFMKPELVEYVRNYRS